MIKFPDKEFMDNLYDHFYPEMCDEMFKTYNAEILRINAPQMPEFDVKYVRGLDYKYACKYGNMWFLSTMKPKSYDMIRKEWSFDHESDEVFANIDQILWLEHINNGKPPENSLICLADYRKEKQK